MLSEILLMGELTNIVKCVLVIVNFPLDDDPEVSVIAWTTTPWTLPSNLALVVHPDLQYVKIRGRIYSHYCFVFN